MQNSSFCDIFESELSEDDKSPGIARNKNPMTGIADNVCDYQQEPLRPVFETPLNKKISRVQVISSPEMGVHNTKNTSTIGLLSSTPEPSNGGENKGSVFGHLFDIDDAFGSLVNLMDKTNVSWTSSMATPVQDVKSTSFNTEERKVLMPIENDVEEISSVCPANQALLTEETENKSLRETFQENDKKCENSPSGSPLCTGNSSNSSWYWADTQTLICRTPHRKSSSRRSKQLKLNSPNTDSSIVQTPKPEYFLFDGNSFPDTNSQIDNLIDPYKKDNSNENEMKRNGVNKSQISKENPLNIERNREQNEINNPSRCMGITQQFSPDLSASMLEEVCLATELLSAEKNNVETQGLFLKESFTANFEHKKVIQSENVSRGVLKSSVKFKSNIESRNNENLNKDNESSKSESHSEEKMPQPDFLGKHSIDDVFDAELSSPISNLEKFRVANRINSTLYNNSRAEPVSCKTFNNSGIFENASKSALLMETGEIFRCQSETNSRKISTSENYPKGFVPFSHLHLDNKTHNSAFGSNEDKLPPTQVSKEMSVRSNDIYLDELHTTSQKSNCHKTSKLLQNEKNLKGFLKGSKKRLRESEMDVCSKVAKIGSDTSLKEENNIPCSTSCKDDIHKETIASVSEPQNKTLGDIDELSIKTNFQNQRLKEERTPVDEMNILIRLLENKDNSAEKIQTLNLMDNILQQHNELQLSQDIFADNENIVDSKLEFQKERGNQNSSNLKESCVTFINSDDICDGYDKENSKLHSYTALKIGNCLPIAFPEKCVTDEMLNGNVMKSSGNQYSVLGNQNSEPTRDLKWENKLDSNVTFPNQGLEEDIFYDNPDSEDSSLKLHERTSFSQKVNVGLSPTLLVTKPTSEKSKNILQTNGLQLRHKQTSSNKSDLIKYNSAKSNSDHLAEAVNHNEIKSRGCKTTTLEKHEESYSNADEEIEHIFSHSNDYDSKEKEKQFSSDLCENKESLNENNKKKGQYSNFHQDYNNLFPKTNRKPIMHAISNVYEDIIRRNKISHDKIAKDTLNLDADYQQLESNASRKRSYNDIEDKKQHILDCHSEEPNKKKQNFHKSKGNIKVSPLYDARNTISFVPDTGQEELSSELTKAESSILPRDNERLSIKSAQSQYNVSEISMENCKMNVQNTDIQISEERCTSPVLSGLSQSSRSIKVSAKSLTKRRNRHMKKKLEQNLCQEKVNVNAKSEGYNSEKILINEQKYIEGHKPYKPLPPNPEKLNKNCVIHKFCTVRSENISVSTDNLEKTHNFESCDVSISENTMELQVDNRIKPKLTVSSTNNKNINVSEKILEKRPTKYESCDYSFSSVNLEHSANHKVDLKFVGSPTARDKTLKVSDAAIMETVETFEGCELSTSTENVQNYAEHQVHLKFAGFSTASGKNIKVPENALKRAQKIFESCENSTSAENLECSAKKQIHFKFDGFSTAGGKNIKVSEDALKRAQKIFEGCEHVYSGENLVLSAQDGVISKFGRISTNSSKSIKVSEPTLKKNEKIFEDSENCSNPKYFECPIKHFINSKFGGFSTASGKTIKFSDAAIKKAEKIFEGCEISTSEKSLEGPAKFGGFSTTGGKKINISEVSLKRARKIVDVCENSPSGVNLEDPAKLGGFSTAGGKNINVSETEPKRAEKIFEGCENSPSVGILEHSAKLGAFSTAGGKNINVSETALKSAKKIIEGCENSASGGNLERPAKLGGFSTVGGKNINISKTALKRAEKIFEGCENSASGGNLECPAKLGGFSTAGGKNIIVSETALKRAQEIFEGCENSPSGGNRERPLKLGGFSTAGGKNINVSETVSEKRGEKIFEGCEKITSAGNMDCTTKQEVDSKFGDFTVSVVNNTKVSDSALNIAQEIFEGSENPTSGKILNCQAKFGGFSTASGNNITVSDAAVKAAKKIFENCEISTSAEKRECLAKHEVNLKFSGFCRTDGNNKNVSVAALDKSKQICEECEISTSEENLKCPAKFAGFSTASGKNTNFSEAALSRAQKIFEDCDNSPSRGNLEHQAKFGGFCTAGGRNINISETALKRAKKIFEGCEKSTSADNFHCSTKGQEDSKFGGFSTARGKNINVSEAALNKARKIFEACEKSTSAENLVCTTKQHVHSKFGGSNVKVSDPELNKAQKILENGENPTSEGNMEKCPTKFGGFSTAGGKNISVSEAALNKARKIFEACEKSTSAENLVCTTKQHVHSKFGGSNVKVSDPELNKAQKILENGENPTSEGNMEKCPTKFGGFSTAGGKNISVSEAALNKARKIFEACEKSTSAENLVCTTKQHVHSKFGGSNVKVSDPELNKAQKILENGENPTSEGNMEKCPTKFGGFSTAGGKNISVSEAALNKARKIFEACEKSTSAENLVCTTKQHVHSKFGGSNVKVSDPELNKAQKILENGENPTSEGNMEKCPTKFGGFSTAGGKNISVSEAALNRARKIFEECENSTSRGNLECPTKFVGCSTAGGKSIIALEDDLKSAQKTFDGYENCGSVNNLEFFPKPLLESNVKGFSSEISKNEEDQGNLLKYGRKINDECVTVVSKRDGVNDLGESRLSFKLQDFGSKGSGSSSMCDINQSKCSKADFLDTKSNKKDTVINVTATTQASDAITYSTITTSSNISPVNISSGIEILADKSIQISCTLEESLKEFESFLPMTAELNVSLSKDSTMLYEDAPQIQSISSSVSTSHSKKDQGNTLTEEKHYLNANDADIEEICHDFLNSSFCTRLSEISHSAGTSVSRKLSFPEYENRELQTSYGAEDSTSRYSTTSNSFNFLTTGNIGCQRRPPLCSTSLLQDETISQEVRECTSALLADEEEEEPGGGTGAGAQTVPAWAHTMLSCPEMVHDRLDAPSPLLCHGEPADAADTPPSPVLGRSDRFGRHLRTRASRRKSKIDKNMNLSGSLNSSPSDVQFGTPEAPVARATSTPIAHPIEQKAPPSSFKVPYKSLTTPTGKQVTPPPPPSSSQPRDARPAASKAAGRTRVPPPPPRARVAGTRPAESSAPAATATPEVAEGRARAAAAQEEAWRARSKGGVSAKRACHGSLQLRKRQERAKRLSLRAATRGLLPARHSRKTLLCYGMKECVVDVSAENAAQFKFHAWEFYSSKLSSENIDGIPVGDGAMLIWDAASKAGVAEVTRAFLSSSGVEPSLIPHGWVENHFRWLVWKLACMERSFPHLFAGRCLTPNVLLLQLRFRYDRELDACERPALRRILEKDDAAGKRLILCVVAVLPLQQADRNKESEKNENSAVSGIEDPKSGSDCELLLTDGWYSILSNVDQEMCRLVRNGQVSVGTKLITYGAELLNCNEGCSPLEVSSAVRLKLHTNSTRRACWDARLGFQKFAGAFPVHLNTILPNGGLVSCVKVIIARLYPVLYFEKVHGEKAILRTERCEMQIAAQFEQQKLQRIEQLFSQEKARYYKENKKKRRASAQELALVSSGQELCEILDSDPDPSALQALLTEEQRRIVLDYQQGYRDQIVQELQTRIQQQMNEDHSATRNVTPVLKVRCLDVRTRDSSKCAILSIWRPSEETTHLLREGCVIKLYSVNAHGIRRGNLQLSTGRQTRYCPVPLPRPIPYFQRRCFNFDEIALRNFQPPFNELDTVGLIVHIGIGPHSSSRFESVYLADADMKIICVSFWGGIKEYGWEDLLQTKTFIAASNLQWRVNSGRQKIINLYASEFTTFAKSPKQQYLKEVLEDLKCNIKIDLTQFVTSCRELILSRLRGEITSDTSVNLDKSTTPLPENHSFLTEWDGMNPDKDMQDTPVRKRLRKLEQFDNPPPISPLNLLSRGEALKKQFKVPSKTTESESCDLNSESPPLSLDDPG